MLGSWAQTGLDMGGHRWKKDSDFPLPLFKKKNVHHYFSRLTKHLRTFGETVFVCLFKLSLSLVNWDMSGLVWWDGERENMCRGVEVENLGECFAS